MIYRAFRSKVNRFMDFQWTSMSRLNFATAALRFISALVILFAPPFRFPRQERAVGRRGDTRRKKENKIEKEKVMNAHTQNGNTTQYRRQSARFALLAVLLLATVGSLVTLSAAQDVKAKPAITIAQLAGPWQIGIVGNTGCGESSMIFTGTLNTSGVAVGTLTGNSAACGPSTSSQTFTITSLSTNGSGTAGLTCGAGCGWTFYIQVSPNKQVFNLVDVTDVNGNNLGGTAVKQ
jgi:hypothetical protein